MRAALIFVGWLLVINLWLAVENIHDLFPFSHFSQLEITLSLVYTAVPLSGALLFAWFCCDFRVLRRWCVVLSGLISGGIALAFFVLTGQFDVGSIGWVFAFTLAGGSIGFARYVKYRDA